jgi:hypothetical protein
MCLPMDGVDTTLGVVHTARRMANCCAVAPQGSLSLCHPSTHAPMRRHPLQHSLTPCEGDCIVFVW